MNKTFISENLRAERIALRTTNQHVLLTNIYENLVDREFKQAEEDINNLISDLNTTLKLIQQDDF